MANKSISRIEGILQFYSVALGSNYNAYRNHVYRVYHLALLIAEKQINQLDEEVLRIAAAFHDLGVWTHGSMDYIDPSETLSKSYLSENQMIELAPKVETVIRFHHKLSSYKGEYEVLTEAFRKADLIDLTKGYVHQGLPKSFYKNLKEEFPFLGFHGMMTKRVIKHAIMHPLKPFPMFRSE